MYQEGVQKQIRRGYGHREGARLFHFLIFTQIS